MLNRVSFIARVLTDTGGGSKAVALWAKHLKHFTPHFMVTGIGDNFINQYDLPNNVSMAEYIMERHGKWNKSEIIPLLQESSVFVSSVANLLEPSGYFAEYDVALQLGIPIVFDCVFGVGSIKNFSCLSFAVTPSIDVMRDVPLSLVGGPCIAAHLPVPYPKSYVNGQEIRRRLDIPRDAFVIGHPCTDGFPWQIGEPAHKFCYQTDSYFISPIHMEPYHNHFRFSGPLVQDEMDDLYDALDVVVHTRPETFGYNTQQAIMMNKPIVLLWSKTSNNGPAEFLYNKAGYIARDQQGILKALHHIKNNPADALERAARAKENLLKVSEINLATKRFESLLVRSAIRSNKMSPSIFKEYEDTEDWFKSQKTNNATWRSIRTQIQHELNYKEFI